MEQIPTWKRGILSLKNKISYYCTHINMWTEREIILLYSGLAMGESLKASDWEQTAKGINKWLW